MRSCVLTISITSPLLFVGCKNTTDNVPPDFCSDTVCGANEKCDASAELCVCAEGYADLGTGCEPIVCTSDEDCSDGNACNGVETCDIANNTCATGNAIVCEEHEICAPEGFCACDQGFINRGNGCEAVACVVDSDCDDGLTCNGEETCDLGLNACSQSTPVACGESATCSEPSGSCACNEGFVDVGSGCEPVQCLADADCDDDNLCNGRESCDHGTNRCLQGEAVVCGSNEICSETSGSCECDAGFVDVGRGCEAIVCTTDAQCDDGLFCNGAESCDLAQNACVPGTRPSCQENQQCSDDLNACTCAGGFEQVNGACVAKSCTTNAQCNDGNACNGTETCHAASGLCRAGSPRTCGTFESCSATNGVCQCAEGYTKVGTKCEPTVCLVDEDCDDGLFCTGRESCNRTLNRCETSVAPCRYNGTCNENLEQCECESGYEAIGSQCQTPACLTDADCDDGLSCNGQEVCDTSANICRRGPAVQCSASNVQCEEPSGTCTGCKPGFEPGTNNGNFACLALSCEEDAQCDDGNACNGRERCVSGRCANGSPTNIREGAAAAAYCIPTDQNNGYSFQCAPGYRLNGDGICAQITNCQTDSDCDDGIFCNGAEVCTANGRCLTTSVNFSGAVICPDGNAICIEDLQACGCAPGFANVDGTCEVDRCYGLTPEECQTADISCPVPQAPAMTIIRNDAVLTFTAPVGYAIELAELSPSQSIEEAVWHSAREYDLKQSYWNPVRIVARTSGQGCQQLNEFDWTYTLVDSYPTVPVVSNALNPYSSAIPAYLPQPNGLVNDSRPFNPLIKGWATGYSEVIYGTQVDYTWRKPWNAVGPALGTFGINVLGNNGRQTLTFDPPIRDGEGVDFAVYENGFVVNGTVAMVFAELGFVEVSSNGVNFVRFDTHALQTANPGAYGNMPPTLFNNIAGTQPAFWGTPYDLRELINRPEVISGLLDLSKVTHVRIIDIVGDASAKDSFGNYVYDATPTWGSGGFDLDAVGVINQFVP